jgi:hypothetical protein
MVMSLDWTDFSHEFEDQGSLRTLLVPGTTIGDWQKMFDWLRDDEYDVAYTVDGQEADMPKKVEEAFDSAGEFAYGYEFYIDGIVVHGTVYHENFAREIEMDVDPVGIDDQQKFDVLVSFMQTLSNKLQKKVLLTQEMYQDEVILRVEPSEEG